MLQIDFTTIIPDERVGHRNYIHLHDTEELCDLGNQFYDRYVTMIKDEVPVPKDRLFEDKSSQNEDSQDKDSQDGALNDPLYFPLNVIVVGISLHLAKKLLHLLSVS